MSLKERLKIFRELPQTSRCVFNDAADPEAFEKLAKRLRWTVPDDVREFFSVVNGQEWEGDTIGACCTGCYFNSVPEMEVAHSRFAEWPPTTYARSSPLPQNPYLPHTNSYEPSWIPLASSAEQGHVVYMNPVATDQGPAGIIFWRERIDAVGPVIAIGMEDLLIRLTKIYSKEPPFGVWELPAIDPHTGEAL